MFFAANAFDLIDDSCTLLHQVLPEVSELPNLCISGIGRENPPDTVRTLSALETLAVIPEEFAKGVSNPLVGLVHP